MKLAALIVTTAAIVAGIHVCFLAAAAMRGLANPWLAALLAPLFIPAIILLVAQASISIRSRIAWRIRHRPPVPMRYISSIPFSAARNRRRPANQTPTPTTATAEIA